MKKGTKQVLALLLVAMMAAQLGVAVAEESDDLISITPTFLPTIGSSASDFYDSEEQRALCATAAILELILYDGDTYTDLLGDALWNGCVYVAKDGLILFVYYFGAETTVQFFYKPLTEEILVTITEEGCPALASYIMETLKDGGTFSSYYEVSASDIMTNLETVSSALAD